MSAEIPSSIVASLGFVGFDGGTVKTLRGFQKGRHTLPTAANATTNAFLAKLCAGELEERAEAFFQNARSALGYKRRDLSLSVASPAATLAAKDFTFELAYALEEADPSRYVITHTLHSLRDSAVVGHAGVDRTFAGLFTELSFGLRKGVGVETVIDAVEGLAGDSALAVDYPSDCHECTITVPEVDAVVRCTGATLDLVFPSAGSPAQLFAGFAAVRAAFAVNPALAALVS